MKTTHKLPMVMRYAHHIVSLLVVVSVLGLCTPVQAQAQPLDTGHWTGEVIGPDGLPKAVIYEVAVENDTLMINLNVPNIGITLPLKEIKLTEGTLFFSFEAPELLECNLQLQNDGSYNGVCSDPSGTTGLMTMIPPQGEN